MRVVKVVIITGIFPPDVGGPATHAADLANELTKRGNGVVVLTLGARRDFSSGYQVVSYPREWPWWCRLVAVALWLVVHRRRYDVAYATGLHPAAVAGARLARRPVVVKVVGDPAWERSARLSLTPQKIDDFQLTAQRSLRVRAMKMLRDWSVRNATATTVPSAYLSRMVRGWAHDIDPVVIYNGVSVKVPERSHRERRGLRVGFVGRLVRHKRVDILIQAIAQLPNATLEVVGDGPARPELEARVAQLGLGERVHFTGDVSRELAVERLAELDVLALATEYEGLPHVVLEALAVGTPVIAPDLPGIREVVKPGVTGELLSEATADRFASAFRAITSDTKRLEQLGRAAREAAADWTFERTVDDLSAQLDRVVDKRPAVVFFGKTPIPRPLTPDLVRKYQLTARHVRPLVIASGPLSVRREATTTFVVMPSIRPRFAGTVTYYTVGAVFAFAAAVARRAVIVTQSPFEATGIVALRRAFGIRAPLVVELHGDWRTAARLYGPRARRMIAPLADSAAEAALRSADRVRAVHSHLADMARDAGFAGDIDIHVAFSDFTLFAETEPMPIPDAPVVAFAGVFETYKGIDVLLEAWPTVAAQIPGVVLEMAGTGSLGEWVRTQVSYRRLDSVRLLGPITREQVRDVLDRACCLVMPSRSEGLPRLILEAMARGRAVITTPVGGIPDLVEDRRTGRLVTPGDADELADAVVKLLRDRDSLVGLGREARLAFEKRDPLRDYEAGIERLARWAAARRG